MTPFQAYLRRFPKSILPIAESIVRAFPLEKQWEAEDQIGLVDLSLQILRLEHGLGSPQQAPESRT